MSRPAGKGRTSYLNLWREFQVFNTAARKFGRRLGKPGMNVSTVFPEGYIENDRVQRHASSMPKENEGTSQEERNRRESKYLVIFILHRKKKAYFYEKQDIF